MPTFKYRAVDNNGELVRGEIEAPTPDAAVGELRAKGLHIVDLKRKRRGFFLKRRKVKRRDLLSFTIQFYSAITSGVSLLKGLEDITREVKNEKLREVLEDIRGRIGEGQSLSMALEAHPDVFPKYYRGAVKTGEETGNLANILEELINLLEKQEEIEAQIKQATTYPAVAFIALFGVALFYILYILPKVLNLVKEITSELPGITKALIFLTSLARNYFYIPLAILFILVIVYFILKKTERGKFFLDKLKLKIPLFGPIYEKALMTRFASYLAMLLRSGVDMLTSFDLLMEVIGNRVFVEHLKIARERIRGGESLSRALRDFPLTPLVFSMIVTGEETGRLEEELVKASEYHEKDVDRSIRRTLTLIEPALLITFGLFAALVFLSVLLPIYATVAKIR